MLGLPGETFARRSKSELRLPATEEGRPTIGREQSIEKEGEQTSPELKYDRRDEFYVATATIKAQSFQPQRDGIGLVAASRGFTNAQREGAISTVGGNCFDATKLSDGLLKI